MRKFAAVAPRAQKPKACDPWEDMRFLPHLVVYDNEDGIYDTGLIDPYGRAIYSFPEKAKIGFTSHLAISEV